jgi:hypothetical protein
MLILKLPRQQICQTLKISYSQLKRDLRRIREQDQEWLDELPKAEFVHQYRLSIEFLENLQRPLIRLSRESQNEFIRIRVTELLANIQQQILNILACGPTVMSLDKMTNYYNEELSERKMSKNVVPDRT